MKLYLVQHAEAKVKKEDPNRPLSENGVKALRKTAKFLETREINVTWIYHSGKLRAKQTAERLHNSIHSLKGIKEIDGLAPMDNPNIWKKRLMEEIVDIMLVGHLPHLSRLSGLLLVGDQQKELIDFKMGGVICLKRDKDGSWFIEWMIIP